MINKRIVEKLGYIDEEVDVNLVESIRELKKSKNATILAHYYQNPEVQDIADFVGDSLALARIATTVKTNIIVFAGVKFMAETTKILNPFTKVLLPDLNAGCSLADSCKYDDFKLFISKYPNHKVVTYVNTTADIKTLSDICCTSSNAVNVVNSFSSDTPIIFAPDKNLGSYVKETTKRDNIVVWNGACHVHSQFSLDKILELKKLNPDAEIIAHPECSKPILIVSNFIGSTAQLIEYTKKSLSKKFIVVTELGVIHQMEKENSGKSFIVAPSECGCSDCSFMKMITLKKLYLTLKYELPEIVLPDDVIEKARLPIEKMISIK